MAKRPEHERRGDLIEVRVVGRRRPTLERKKAEREGLEQGVLFLKAEEPAELLALSALACTLFLEACDGPAGVVYVFELTFDELLSDGEISGPLSFFAGLFADRHVKTFNKGISYLKKAPGAEAPRAVGSNCWG